MKSERFVQIFLSADGKTLSISYWKREAFPHIDDAAPTLICQQDATDTPNPQELMIRISSWIFFECF